MIRFASTALDGEPTMSTQVAGGPRRNPTPVPEPMPPEPVTPDSPEQPAEPLPTYEDPPPVNPIAYRTE